MKIKLILASASPRRQQILQQAGLEPEIVAAEVQELTGNLPPVDLARANAELKAQAVAELRPEAEDAWILAADTIVALAESEKDWRIFGKPADAAEAEQMLAALSGREHSVFTGVAVWHKGRLTSDAAESRVCFRALQPAEIAAYVAGGEPLDKAGAYAVQGGAAAFVRHIDGDLDNIVGLPMRLVWRLLPAGVQPEYSTK